MRFASGGGLLPSYKLQMHEIACTTHTRVVCLGTDTNDASHTDISVVLSTDFV